MAGWAVVEDLRSIAVARWTRAGRCVQRGSLPLRAPASTAKCELLRATGAAGRAAIEYHVRRVSGRALGPTAVTRLGRFMCLAAIEHKNY